jgi:hypothetical protein
MKKETVKIDSRILKKLRPVARILGISISQYLEKRLEQDSHQIEDEGVIAEKVEAYAYRQRKRAEAIA